MTDKRQPVVLLVHEGGNVVPVDACIEQSQPTGHELVSWKQYGERHTALVPANYPIEHFKGKRLVHIDKGSVVVGYAHQDFGITSDILGQAAWYKLYAQGLKSLESKQFDWKWLLIGAAVIGVVAWFMSQNGAEPASVEEGVSLLCQMI